MDIDLKLSGARIRAVRKERNVTVRKLAELVGITEESMMHIECGARRPSYQTIYSIAEALDASLDFLTGRVNRPNEYVATPLIKEEGLSDEQASVLEDLVKALVPVVKKKI